MAQVNFDWITGAFRSFQDPSITTNTTGADTFGAQFPLVDVSDLEDKEDSLRVERVLGSSYITFKYGDETVHSPQDAVAVYERIYVSEADALGNPETAHDMTLAADFDRSFLWERVQILSSVNSVGAGLALQTVWEQWATNYNAFHVPYFTRIDCGVKRRLKDRELLIYDVQAQVATGPDVDDLLIIVPRLRVGVRF